jgi:hypothetical protein
MRVDFLLLGKLKLLEKPQRLEAEIRRQKMGESQFKAHPRHLSPSQLMAGHSGTHLSS